MKKYFQSGFIDCYSNMWWKSWRIYMQDYTDNCLILLKIIFSLSSAVHIVFISFCCRSSLSLGHKQLWRQYVQFGHI